MTDIVYKKSPTTQEFHESDKFVRGLIGPIGSGKSVACCFEIFTKAMEQEAFEGVRRSRWIIVRNTYRELMDTTLETWFSWFPESMGVFQKMNMKHIIKLLLEDGTIMELEVLFRALDKPDDIKKLLSLELTGGWLNECREIPKAVLDMLIGRLGRYPSKRQGGPSWYGAIADTNPPDEDHWWYKLFELNLPHNYGIFHQPSGLSEQTENIDNLPKGYYINMQAGKDEEWINVYVHGKYGFVIDGKPIYPEFNASIHTTKEAISIPDEATIWIGIDFGRTPAAAFGYEATDGQWIIFDELVTDDMGAKKFAIELGAKIRRDFINHPLEIYGDPKGNDMTQVDDDTPFLVLRANGINAWPTDTNDPVIRREAVANNLTRLTMTGKPGVVLGPKARILAKAMIGGYKYKRMAVSGQERFQDKPDKNMYSHIAEALQYLMLGAGEGEQVIGGSLINQAKIDYSEHDRGVI